MKAIAKQAEKKEKLESMAKRTFYLGKETGIWANSDLIEI